MANQIETNRQFLLQCLNAGLKAVNGEHCTRKALLAQSTPQKPTHIIAIGKAAPSMLRGAHTVLQAKLQSGLLITSPHYQEPNTPPNITVLPGAHPLPDENSCRAGQAVCDYLQNLPAQANILFLISGGTSAMLEHPRVSLKDLQRINNWLLASGLPINSINAIRSHLSHIKGGGLLNYLPAQANAQVLLISDTPDDNPATIGSGLLYPPTNSDLPPNLPDWLTNMIESLPEKTAPEPPAIPHQIIANNTTCRSAIADFAKQHGVATHDHGQTLNGDAAKQGTELANYLQTANPGLHIYGGETTVTLPPNPGKGGRNQHLALTAAKTLAGQKNILLLAAGTDGIDGNTPDAGALIDGNTQTRGTDAGLQIEDHLQHADSNIYLQASHDLIHTGPTGTNVMDIVLGLKVAEPPN